MRMFTRRYVLTWALPLLLPGGCSGPAPAPFSFFVLDDVHYAAEADYDWQTIDTFDQTMAERVRRTVARSEATFLPLLKELKTQAETAQPTPAAIFSCGDLVHGAVAVKPDEHFRHFFRIYESVHMPIPLFNANGNHEMAEAGMEDAYNRHFLPFLSAQAGREITTRYFSVDIGNARCILLDGLPPERDGGDHEARIWALKERQWQWLEEQLETAGDKQHIFVFSHAPLWPIRGGDVMYVFDHERHRRLVDLLLRYNVRVFFAGHQHQNSVIVYTEGDRQLIQMIPSSDLSAVEVPARDTQVLDYTPEAAVPAVQREWDRRARLLVQRYQQGITYFETTPGVSGYFLVAVEGPGVTVRMFRGTGRKLFREYTIRRDPGTGATRFQ
jgi:3',5'-cyclic AMP phosphodiesterase CpdA